ncbi:hypothetical protein BLA29_006073, partial [Euroglyphus maynei]
MMMNESENDTDDVKNDGHEQERLQRKLAHAEGRLARLERYNEELRTELRLMTEKFLLSKQLDQQQISIESKESGELKSNRIIKKEELEEIKALSEKFSDYYFDSKSNTYFSRSTGWYYYPESETFYNPDDKRYYKYDESSKQYIFICNLDGTTTTTTTNVKKKEKSLSSGEDIEMEDGEINDDDGDCIDISSDSDENNRHQQSKKKSSRRTKKESNKTNVSFSSFPKRFNNTAPCRLVVKQSDSLENG